MKLAPIALFVYNRPWHTRQTIKELQKNGLAGESDLFIFSDAPNKPEVTKAVQEVRDYIKTISGFRSVKIIERAENFGLSKSIIDGVTRLCSEHGRIIVIEDDLLTSPYFLKYMNDALDLYELEERVISIHGYMYPVDAILPETFFLRGASCWGWATWKRGWNLFEPDGQKLLMQIKKLRVENEFNYNGSYDLLGMLRSQVEGKIDSWAIRWYASAFLANKLTLYPGKSLVQNIGFDGSGKNCGTTDVFFTEFADHPVALGRQDVYENLNAQAAISQYFRTMNQPFFWRALRIGKKWWKKFIVSTHHPP